MANPASIEQKEQTNTQQENSTKKQLEDLKKQIEGEQDIKKKFELQRAMVLLERLDTLQEGHPEYKNIQKKVDIIFASLHGKDMRNSDLLTLKKLGIDIANLTLVYKNNPLKDVSSKTMKAGDIFVVNFGKNTALRDRTGAGDILPAEVKNIKINGVACERKNTPRPGYYDEKGNYQVIYDGYTIELLTFGNVSKDDVDASERQWKRERVEDMLESGGKPLTELDEDKNLENEAREELKFRNKYQSINFDIKDISLGDKGLLDFIGICEGTGENYNAIYGNGSQSSIQFTSMTLNEVLSYQKTYKAEHGSAAIGRYQFMDYTLKDMIQKYGIDPNATFSAEFQDRLAFLKLNERGLASFKAGRMLKDDFQMNLAREWASIAKDESGLSYYHGDSMNNHASRAGQQVGAVLDKLYS